MLFDRINCYETSLLSVCVSILIRETIPACICSDVAILAQSLADFALTYNVRALIYRAHRAVVFAIAQLSCFVFLT